MTNGQFKTHLQTIANIINVVFPIYWEHWFIYIRAAEQENKTLFINLRPHFYLWQLVYSLCFYCSNIPWFSCLIALVLPCVCVNEEITASSSPVDLYTLLTYTEMDDGTQLSPLCKNEARISWTEDCILMLVVTFGHIGIKFPFIQPHSRTDQEVTELNSW